MGQELANSEENMSCPNPGEINVNHEVLAVRAGVI
jgi:hypothetical protein